ncbi:uncharacterized protein [Typha angustifolia]|uniref:uncharacterized protein n=1 Tax=Typha angustifolia TaxID=59011 RepID=UPI003C308C79
MGIRHPKREPLVPPPQDASPKPNPCPVSVPATGDETAVAAEVGVYVEGSEEDAALRSAAFLTREEVLRRRSRRLRQLAACYRRHYWALVEEVRVKHRDYYWEYGKSPTEEAAVEEEEENGEGNLLGLGFGENGGLKKGERRRCALSGCKSKAMPLTRYCHPHILSDPKQTLYKACTFVIKSAQTGQIVCGKPVLRAATPSLCCVHYQRAQRGIAQALKKAGLNMSTSKTVPKFSVLVAECVRQIQTRRREALNASIGNLAHKNEKSWSQPDMKIDQTLNNNGRYSIC